MKTWIVGVDPGKTGGVAVLDTVFPSESAVYDMPMLGPEPDSRELARLMSGAFLVVIEFQGAMPKQGVSSTFSLGMQYGKILAVADLSGARILRPRPAEWKRGMSLIGKEKDDSRAEAIRQFPQLAGMLSRKMDHGRAEALLIALWGQRHEVT